ncbi:hypothetical protein [Streptomyces spinosirectus]
MELDEDRVDARQLFEWLRDHTGPDTYATVVSRGSAGRWAATARNSPRGAGQLARWAVEGPDERCREPLWELYALSRVSDVLLLAFQPPGDPDVADGPGRADPDHRPRPARSGDGETAVQPGRGAGTCGSPARRAGHGRPVPAVLDGLTYTGLTPEEQRELLRHRCLLRTPADAAELDDTAPGWRKDLYPYPARLSLNQA